MMRNISCTVLICLAWARLAFAVPETVSLRVTDVTASSFSIVWMTDVPAVPTVEVYGDVSMVNRLTESVTLVPMPDAPPDVAAAARGRGIMKVLVAGLAPNTAYYVRSVTVDPLQPSSIATSALQQVTTAAAVVPYTRTTDGVLQGFANDLVSMRVYLRPSEENGALGLGSLLLLETPDSPYPVTAYVGAGTAAPEGILDLNNLFGKDMTSRMLAGGEKTTLSVYRGGVLSTLTHYRRIPTNSTMISVGEPVKGAFADINLDGRVDEQDFAEFRKQFRTEPNGLTYNPDYNFVEDSQNPDGLINAQDFARFAREYGRTNVQ